MFPREHVPSDIENEELADNVFKMILSEDLGVEKAPVEQLTFARSDAASDALVIPPPNSFAAIWLLDVEIATRFAGGVTLKNTGLRVSADSKEASRIVMNLDELQQWFRATRDRLQSTPDCDSLAEELRLAVLSRLTENIAQVEEWMFEVRGIQKDTASDNGPAVVDTSKRLIKYHDLT